MCHKGKQYKKEEPDGSVRRAPVFSAGPAEDGAVTSACPGFEFIVGGENRMAALHEMLGTFRVVDARGGVIVAQGNAPLFRFQIRIGYGGEKRPGVGVDRIGENLLFGSRLDHIVQMQYSDAVGDVLTMLRSWAINRYAQPLFS